MRLRQLVIPAAVIVVCSACLGSQGHAAPNKAATPSETLPHTRAHLGVEATFPASWSVVWRPCPACASPRSIFVAASFRLTGRLRAMSCRRMPAGAAVVSLSEALPKLLGAQAPSRRDLRHDFPSRPASFRLSPLARLGVMETCAQPRARLLRFRDSGRFLYAWATFGPHPSPGVLDRAQAILDSLRIAPLDSLE